jgi:hypothetical protein
MDHEEYCYAERSGGSAVLAIAESRPTLDANCPCSGMPRDEHIAAIV